MTVRMLAGIASVVMAASAPAAPAVKAVSEYQLVEIQVWHGSGSPTVAEAQAKGIVKSLRSGTTLLGLSGGLMTDARVHHLGWVSLKQLPENVAAVVRATPAGAVAEPMHWPDYYSILIVTGTR